MNEQDERGACEVELEKSVWTRQTEARNAFRDGWDAGRAWQARAASTSANVAQGAEALKPNQIQVMHTIATADNAATILHGLLDSFVEVAAGFPEAKVDEALARQARIYLPNDAAPPAQTSLTDDARDAERYRLIRQGKAIWVKVPVKGKFVEYFIGHKPEPNFPECFDNAIDAALTAAQSASGADHAN